MPTVPSPVSLSVGALDGQSVGAAGIVREGDGIVIDSLLRLHNVDQMGNAAAVGGVGHIDHGVVVIDDVAILILGHIHILQGAQRDHGVLQAAVVLAVIGGHKDHGILVGDVLLGSGSAQGEGVAAHRDYIFQSW